ncbi:MAG: sigma factor-like helix-turn-helix DNA-binding protein [Pseudomonadota bacterium]
MDSRTDLADRIVDLLPRLQRLALALSGDPDLARSLTHDAVDRALDRLDGWRRDTRLDVWLFRQLIAWWTETGSPSRPASAGEAAARLVAALPDDQRLAAALVLVDGCSYREAADILAVTPGVVAGRLARAREALLQGLAQ